MSRSLDLSSTVICLKPDLSKSVSYSTHTFLHRYSDTEERFQQVLFISTKLKKKVLIDLYVNENLVVIVDIVTNNKIFVGWILFSKNLQFSTSTLLKKLDDDSILLFAVYDILLSTPIISILKPE